MEENLQVILVVIVGISFMVGLAALILWIKDRATWTGAIVKRILGAISLFIGLSVAGWIVYNLFYPTEHFRWGPMVFLSLIWVGAKWLFGSEPGLESQDIDWDSAELQAAMQQAKETLPNFIRQVSGGVDQGYVKFPFQTDQGVIEHIWGHVTIIRTANSPWPWPTNPSLRMENTIPGNMWPSQKSRTGKSCYRTERSRVHTRPLEPSGIWKTEGDNSAGKCRNRNQN